MSSQGMPAHELKTQDLTQNVACRLPHSGGQGSFSLFPASRDDGRTSSTSERCETPEPEEIPHIQRVPAPVSAPAHNPMPSLSTRVPYRQPAPPPAKSSSSKPSQPKRRRLANAYKEGVIKSALRRALLAHNKDKRSPSSSVGVGLGLVAGILARARAAMGVASPSSPQSPPVPPSSSSRSIFAAIPTPMPLPAKGTPSSLPSSNIARGVLRPRKRPQLGPWFVLVERRMKLKQVLGGKGKQVAPLPKPKTVSVPAPAVKDAPLSIAKDVKPALRREGSTLLAC
ncbi:hypothetical protein EXIGLDRAFT_445089 [Exidia glandulosa HHB12029]|uniref:Uncharacterized protein n=1 Tax=Exidia glandulosa HHB12029 TaxID=1314781 RepID=A0A165B656_EXIGL|nr:hypothetical protein EXIGLDRAFT_445089 [Exidia glandulosa HHB12029]